MTPGHFPTTAGPAQKKLRLLIVDGHAYAYRAFFGIRRLTSPSGSPTNAIYGFIKSLEKLKAWFEPTHWVVVWDGGLAEERLAALPEYKAQRPPMPPSLAEQLPGLEAYLEGARIPSCRQTGVEADDWIATIARHASGAGVETAIASSDKDFMQLVSDHVGIINPNDSKPAVWSAEQVRDKFEVGPEQIIDWLSLVGDTVDNIPGVPGIGPKNASKLLNQFGSVERMFACLDEVKPESLRERLRAAVTLVRRNQELVRLRDELPGEFSLDDLVVKPPETSLLRKRYEEWGFKSLLRELNPDALRQADLFK
ncbi:MAG: hypothetical protein M1608_09645 [Candidatus Omnitrophica bacterium]|nr:hypothetical protein [Candidatus Omnitrophota bacterium]